MCTGDVLRTLGLFTSFIKHALRTQGIHFVHRNPLRVSNSIPAVRDTSFQQPKEVSKKGRAPTKFYYLRDLPNKGRKEMFPTYFAKMTSMSFILYLSALLGELGVAGKSKAWLRHRA
ncbi:MAG: hypothetical protein ABJK64_09035 [Paraglaciecola sp.]|uniref:hypothetical protein n=1 Tax=Paraglaciecola sp. TaxID=1920173 RepID=UPI00329A1749